MSLVQNIEYKEDRNVHALKLFYKVFHLSGAIGHVMRLNALLKDVDGLPRGCKLSLTLELTRFRGHLMI